MSFQDLSCCVSSVESGVRVEPIWYFRPPGRIGFAKKEVQFLWSSGLDFRWVFGVFAVTWIFSRADQGRKIPGTVCARVVKNIWVKLKLVLL